MPSYSIHDKVFDAALNKVKADASAKVAQITTVSLSAVLVDSIPTSAGLDGSNFTGPASYASGGRQLTVMVSKSNDMKSISVSSAGAAARLIIQGSSGSALFNYVVASISPAVSLGASDKVNISSFLLILKDPA